MNCQLDFAKYQGKMRSAYRYFIWLRSYIDVGSFTILTILLYAIGQGFEFTLLMVDFMVDFSGFLAYNSGWLLE